MTTGVRQVLLVGVLTGLLSSCSWLLPFDGAGQGGDGSSGEASFPGDGGGNEGSGRDVTLHDSGADGTGEGGVSTDGSTPGGDLSPDAPPPSCIEQCKVQGGWCPTPTGVTEPINDLAGSGPGELWAVGDKLTVLRFDPVGCQWKTMPSPAAAFISTSTNLNGVAVLPNGQVMVVGGDGGRALWNGSAWKPINNTCTPFSINQLQVIAANPAGDHVYAAGAGGIMARWNKSSLCWEAVAAGTSGSLISLAWGDNKFYVGGNGVLLAQKDATTFQTLCSPGGALYGLWASSAGQILGVGTATMGGYGTQTYDPANGCFFTSQGTYPAWRDVAGNDLQDLWLVGDEGRVGRKQGVNLNASSPLTPTSLRAVWVNPDASKPLVVTAGAGGKAWINVP